MADYYVQSETLTDIADAIRAKKNSSNSMAVKDMANEISSISSGINTNDATATADEIFAGETAYVKGNKVTGTFTIDNELTTQDDLIAQIQTALADKGTPSGTNTNDATATAGDILSGKTAYVKGEKITGTIATATQATPSISVSSSGLITASATQSVGYVAAGTKSATKQLTTQAAKTVTPTKNNQTAVASGVYTTGAVTVGAIPSNYIVPSGTKTITTNGTHDVKSYASATVNVASTGEDVTAETNAYTEKLATLETAITALESELQGKASGGSGGGSVETCTVTITLGRTNGTYGGVGYTSVQNNEIIACNKLLDPNNTVEITCLCGSVLVVDETLSRLMHTYDNLAEIANEQDATYLGEKNMVKVFQVLAPANGTASLIIETHGE